MKNTLQKINELAEIKIIDKYAIAGGIANFYYIEPSVTYDLDIVVNLTNQTLDPLRPIFDWAYKNNYVIKKEHVIIEGTAVQFLPVYNNLIAEALKESVEIELFGVKTYIFRAEHLMAILLETFREKDKERLVKFLTEYEYDKEKYKGILKRHNLLDKFMEFNNAI